MTQYPPEEWARDVRKHVGRLSEAVQGLISALRQVDTPAEANAALRDFGDIRSSLGALEHEMMLSQVRVFDRFKKQYVYQNGRFATWMNALMPAASMTTADLADAYVELRSLYPRRHDKRRKRNQAARIAPPKKEMGEYRKGTRWPGPVVAYRIGRAIENRLRDVPIAYNARKRQDPSGCGLDALVVAGHWPDAIACVGAYTGRVEGERNPLTRVASGSLFYKRAIGMVLPKSVYPILDEVWVDWITDPDPATLPSRFQAAYILAARHSDGTAMKLLTFGLS